MKRHFVIAVMNAPINVLRIFNEKTQPMKKQTPRWLAADPRYIIFPGIALFAAAWFIRNDLLNRITGGYIIAALAYLLLPRFYYMIKGTINDNRGK